MAEEFDLALRALHDDADHQRLIEMIARELAAKVAGSFPPLPPVDHDIERPRDIDPLTTTRALVVQKLAREIRSLATLLADVERMHIAPGNCSGGVGSR